MSSLEVLVETPAALAAAVLLAPAKLLLWSEWVVLQASAPVVALVQGLLMELPPLLLTRRGLRALAYGEATLPAQRAISVPAPSTPPPEDDTASADRPHPARPADLLAAVRALERPRTPKARAAPGIPQYIITERFTVQETASEETSPSASGRSLAGSSSAMGKELEDSRRRLRLMQVEAERLAGGEGLRSFPLDHNVDSP